MNLCEGKKGNCYLIRSVSVDENITRRLEALGVNEQTPITILGKKGSGTLIIKVRGTRLALGHQIASGIQVEEAVHE